jgi:hypothetical protein
MSVLDRLTPARPFVDDELASRSRLLVAGLGPQTAPVEIQRLNYISDVDNKRITEAERLGRLRLGPAPPMRMGSTSLNRDAPVEPTPQQAMGLNPNTPGFNLMNLLAGSTRQAFTSGLGMVGSVLHKSFYSS